MATGAEVLSMLIPQGGWIITGEEYEGIEFLECDPITEAEYTAGFDQFDAWKLQDTQNKAVAKAALLQRLGITEEEAQLLLS
jgi:helix-turn-helix protein